MTRRSVTLELPWPPASGNNAVRHAGRGVHFKTPAAKAYEAQVARVLADQGWGRGDGRSPLPGPLAVSWLLAPPDRRARDLDNLRKVVADALTRGGLWADDSNKVLARERFEWTEPVKGGLVAVSVEEVAP